MDSGGSKSSGEDICKIANVFMNEQYIMEVDLWRDYLVLME